MNNNINSDVNLASQTHQVPHIGFPQIDPVTKARKVKRAPVLAEEIDKTSLELKDIEQQIEAKTERWFELMEKMEG